MKAASDVLDSVSVYVFVGVRVSDSEWERAIQGMENR